MAESVGDDLVTGGKIVRISDHLAEGVGMFDEAAVGVVVVANGLNASGIGYVGEVMSGVVVEVGGVAFAVGEADEISGGTDVVRHQVAGWIRDSGEIGRAHV